jgi:hypothetical protein
MGWLLRMMFSLDQALARRGKAKAQAGFNKAG